MFYSHLDAAIYGKIKFSVQFASEEEDASQSLNARQQMAIQAVRAVLSQHVKTAMFCSDGHVVQEAAEALHHANVDFLSVDEISCTGGINEMIMVAKQWKEADSDTILLLSDLVGLEPLGSVQIGVHYDTPRANKKHFAVRFVRKIML